jgi:hypothetical protein
MLLPDFGRVGYREWDGWCGFRVLWCRSWTPFIWWMRF